MTTTGDNDSPSPTLRATSESTSDASRLDKSRLSQAHLARVPDGIATPKYDRSRVTTGIVHFGPGAFHRVHQAWYVDRVLADDPRWAISAVALRQPDVIDALVPQDGLYTLATRGDHQEYAVLGAITELLHAPRDPQRVLQRLCAAGTHLVTLTVTEKGYCLGGDGRLDFAHADIVHDLAHPHAPRSAIGFLVAACARRHAEGHAPLTLMSCDNLGDNGARLRGAVVALASRFNAALAERIAAEVAFPRTMVDSITPATTDALRDEVAGALGLVDRWPVQREPFTQWVIEAVDGTRKLPDFASVGATITDDVAAYDRAKLRFLNGAHSSLAYLGLLAGFETVSQASTDPLLQAFLGALMRDEIKPAVAAPRGLDVDAYIDAILTRFRNPAIRHELAQIAWDGSQKLPVRLAGTLIENLVAARPVARIALGIAAWMHFVRRAARDGRRIVDPLADRLIAIGHACTGDASADVARFIALAPIAGALRDRRDSTMAPLVQAYHDLDQNDVRAVLSAAIA